MCICVAGVVARSEDNGDFRIQWESPTEDSPASIRGQGGNPASAEAWGIVHPSKVRYGRGAGVEIKPPEGARLKGVVMDVAGTAGDYVIWFPKFKCQRTIPCRWVLHLTKGKGGAHVGGLSAAQAQGASKRLQVPQKGALNMPKRSPALNMPTCFISPQKRPTNARRCRAPSGPASRAAARPPRACCVTRRGAPERKASGPSPGRSRSPTCNSITLPRCGATRCGSPSPSNCTRKLRSLTLHAHAADRPGEAPLNPVLKILTPENLHADAEEQVKLPEENRPKTSDSYGRANRLASRQMAQGIGEVYRFLLEFVRRG
jgi:hypothetical protein